MLIFSTLAFGIPEKDFERNWKEKVLPYFEALDQAEFTNARGMRIRFFYRTEEKNSKTLILVPGRSEPSLKYAELIFDLKDSGYDIFIIDHQGQGESERLLSDTHKGHVLNFNDYVKDFNQFYSLVSKIKNNSTIHLIAHSMGGAIATKFMSQNQKAIDRAVLIAPMMKLNTPPYPEPVARIFAKLLVRIGKGENYAPDYGPYIPEEDLFETNQFTSSEGRFNISKYIFTNWPHLTVGGPTARWVNESLKATKHIHKLPFETRVLLFQAGLDEIVKNSRQTAFCREFCRLVRLPNAKHEILVERDEIRNEAMKEIKSFLGI